MGNRRAPAATRGAKGTQQQKGRFGSGAIEFTRGVRNELRRVNWPNRDQLQQSTAVVVIIVLVLMAYVAFWDFIFQRLAELIFIP
jgi:preprotein translocase subunit SecE